MSRHFITTCTALLNNVHKPSIPELFGGAGGGLEGTPTFTSRKLWMDIGPMAAHDGHII